jgi:agmatine deiminase
MGMANFKEDIVQMTWKSRSILTLFTIAIALFLSMGWTQRTIAQSVANRAINTQAIERAIAAADTFVMPAEFEEIESIWMAYPVYENIQGRPSQTVQADMIQALAPHVAIDLMVQDEAEQQQVEQWLSSLNLPPDRVRLHLIPHADIWVRDMGPIFLKNSEGEKKIADFGFNIWSYADPTSELATLDESVDRLVAREHNLPIARSSLISEGGNREFNGNGILMVTEAVELQRNPGMTKAEIEAELQRIFNVQKVIWLKQGLADDDLSYKGKLPGDVFTVLTTGGHIDEFARFVDSKTILLAQVTPKERDEDPIARITYERMEENYRILRSATDRDGKPFTIVRMPIPVPIYEMMDGNDEIYKQLKALTYEDGTTIQDGSTIKTILAASYLNYVIANDVVLIPAYWKEGRPESFRQKDRAAKRIFQRVFPDRQIVQINPENVNAGGGGMHCIVQQMPK